MTPPPAPALALLTAPQERSLARAMRRNAAGPRTAKAARDARERLILCNQGLVVSIALGYCGKGLDLDDLIHEGTTGLIRAVDLFDPELGYKFSTYATRWIRQAIRLAIMEVPMVHVPSHVRVDLAAERGGRQRPSDRREGRAGWAPGREKRHVENLDAGRAADALARTYPDDAGRDSASFLATVAEDRQPGPPELAAAREEVEYVRGLLGVLDPRERAVVVLRHGLDGRGERTLKEAGAEMGVSREWVRRLGGLAMGKMRRAAGVTA